MNFFLSSKSKGKIYFNPMQYVGAFLFEISEFGTNPLISLFILLNDNAPLTTKSAPELFEKES
jgi:hypothetical protein